MTFSLSRAVGSTGRVFTFEYNKERQEYIKDVFLKIGATNVR